jgi:2'-5' RNA ligase
MVKHTLSDAPQMDLLGGDPAVPAETHRLFFALFPTGPVRDRLAAVAESLAAGLPPGEKWFAAERYHATLHFLGDYPMLRHDLVASAQAAAARVSAAPFTWTLDNVGSFRGNPPPCVVRGSATSDALELFWRDLRRELVLEGHARQVGNTFTPHVTLARLRSGMLEDTPIVPIEWRVDGFALVHSIFGQRDYRVLGRWDFPSAE